MTNQNVENMKYHVIGVVKGFFEKHFSEDTENLGESFEQQFTDLLQQYEQEATSEIEGFRRLITAFKPALTSVLPPGEEFDKLLTMVLWMFKAPWEGANRRKKKPSPKREGPLMPGSDQSIDITFYCAVCKEKVDIPPEVKKQILNAEDEVELPKHCGKDLRIRISQIQEEPPIEEDDDEEPVESVEFLMGHIPSENVEYLKVLSVGIDIGSSTSHLVFSRLTLRRETSIFNLSNRFYLINREIIYEGTIILTPLIDRYTIDIDSIVEFCEEEYRKAGIDPEMVETGAVIVTGETAKKQNAAEIVKRLSSESGKFVSAAAGPNLESLLGAMGSGVVDRSRETQRTIMNVDIGGGTSNLAIASNGQVLSTSCINVGGRLLGIDEDFRIWRIDDPSYFLMKELNMNYQLGDIIPEADVKRIAREYAKALVEVMRGPATSHIAKELMMTDGLDFSIPIDDFSFSGGIAEMIYNNTGTAYNDIGTYLAEEIQTLAEEHKLPMIEPENKIRATVIGAGAFSLSVSGSTTYFDERIDFPIDNIPVIPVNVRKEEFSPEKVVEEVKRAFMNFDMVEGEDLVALYFKELLFPSYRWLPIFAKALEQALPNSVANKKLIILVFAYDMGKMLGIAIRDETSIQSNLLCLDELQLEAGDWIDIGAPLQSTQAFPVTVKSLVFNQSKEYSSK